MIEIDGSYGEGGGQILRTAISLSAVTMEPVRVVNIRAGRPTPGLKNQHIAGIEVTGRLVNAEIKGLRIGSTTIEFHPVERRGGRISYDIGTAGAISLALQAALLPAVLSPDQSYIEITGGTDVLWSPPIDYMKHVFDFMLQKMGPKIEITQHRRGHYPRGGGRVSCGIKSVNEIHSIDLVEFGEILEVVGISHCARLPAHVAHRQADAAESYLRGKGLENINIEREYWSKEDDPHLGAGSGIVIWAESNRGVRIGGDSLGKKGKPAEKVGREAAIQLVSELSTGKAVDSHLCDMLVPYMAVAQGKSSIGVTKITSHLETNIWVAEEMLGIETQLEGESGKPGRLTLKGTGVTSSN
ncbi:MAG: RNA 3'-terminal phosphate cyclase [Candidatus Thorarchaeota archaeon]